MNVLPKLLALLVVLFAIPGQAAAHDDPIITVRVLCNGFNVLDPDAVRGEIADSATLSVEGNIRGSGQIDAWIRDQMANDLRIEIVDIGTPQKLTDGYALTWTARFSRQDWRKAGVTSRQAANDIVIRNGRIIEWTAALDAGATAAAAQPTPVAPVVIPVVAQTPFGVAIPEVLGVPVTLVFAAGVIVVAGSLLVRSILR